MKRAEMLALNEFLHRSKDFISEHGLDDVLDLFPLFEQLELDWEFMIDRVDGQPVTTLVYQSNLIRVILVYWDGQYRSEVHGHPNGGGLFKVLSGRLEETRYDPDGVHDVIDSAELTPGEISYIHDMLAYHQVKNPDRKPAVSLHIYSLNRRKSA